MRYLLASFVTTQFGKWQSRWHGQPTTEPTVGKPVSSRVDPDNEGALVLFDVIDGVVLGARVLDTPAGFCLTSDEIFVTSMYGNHISVFDHYLRRKTVLATPLMNDLHSVAFHPGGLLVT
jgi:hypothetical protein